MDSVLAKLVRLLNLLVSIICFRLYKKLWKSSICFYHIPYLSMTTLKDIIPIMISSNSMVYISCTVVISCPRSGSMPVQSLSWGLTCQPRTCLSKPQENRLQTGLSSPQATLHTILLWPWNTYNRLQMGLSSPHATLHTILLWPWNTYNRLQMGLSSPHATLHTILLWPWNTKNVGTGQTYRLLECLYYRN